jgi:ABC-2 type transport system permease protein
MPQVQQAIPVAIKTSLSLLLDDGAVLGPASPLWLPVQALQGSPLPLLLFCLAALGSAQLAAVLLQHSFLRLLQQGRNSPRGIARLALGMRLHFGHACGGC